MKVGMDQFYVGVSTGGGGHGNPFDRDIEQVRRNVRDGIISREMARSVFGVAVDDALDPAILAEETAKLRAPLAGKVRPPVDPVSPGAGRWAEDQMKDGDVFLLNPS
jgi:N-methylhydantoinase B